MFKRNLKKPQMYFFPKIRVYMCLFAFFPEFVQVLCIFLYICLKLILTNFTSHKWKIYFFGSFFAGPNLIMALVMPGKMLA